MDIIVTGGAGYIGSTLCKYLNSKNISPITIDNLCQGKKEFINWGPFYNVDLKNVNSFDFLKKHNVQAVVHLAAHCYVNESIANPKKYFLNNINSTINVIDMMVKNNIKYLIFSSSCAVYGETKDLLINEESQKNPINPYGLSKLICENIIKSYADIYNLKFISLRFFNVGGADLSLEVGECHNPETHLIPRAISCCLNDETLNIYGNQFDTIDGFAIRDFIHVNDLADAIYKSLKYLFSGGSNNYINLGTGLGFSVKMILDKISSHFNKKINYKIYNQKSGNPPMLVSDNAKAAKILNWHPLNSDLKTIISTACDWYDVASKKGYL